MSQKFYKGRTNNHLTWVMVDATDFATPESALSAATKIMLHGKLRSSSLVHFVSSGTGSMAGGDIKHVGASATGVYTVALTKPDLSDASAAWYDQYIATITGTGAAQQVLVIPGEIDASAFSDVLSNAYSAASVGSSRILLVQSRLSDLNSTLNSDLSDIRSMLTALSDAISDAHSDLGSKIGAITVTISASDLSDIASAVVANMTSISASDISDIASAVWAHAIGARVDSRVLVVQSMVSDIRSDVSDMHSDLLVMSGILSDAYSALGAGVQLNASSLSDLRSAISAGAAATITASDISDIASAVWANTIGARVDSRVRLIQSDTSDIASRITGAVATKSQVASATFALFSDFMSNVTSAFAANSDAISDLKSVVTVTGVQLNASTMSDLRSAVSAVAAGTVTASDMSDIASRVEALLVSRLSDILSAAVQTNSRVALVQSNVSDLASAVTVGVQLNASSLSDIRSAITAATFTLSASDISDIASAVQANLSSNLSDILSAAQQTNSRVLVAQSQLSDAYSLLSDLHSDVGVMSGIVSDIQSAVTSVGFKKNTAITDFEFLMVASSDHITPQTGLTITATRSIDGGAFAACTNAAAELSNGIYVIDLSAADLNGNIVTFRFTSATADDRFVTIKTQS